MWTTYCDKVGAILRGLSASGGDGAALTPETAFCQWTEMALSLRAGGAIHLIGNGASASMASHFAADITKNCRIRAVVFTDCALLTALSNDYGYENGYATALERYARPGDMLVAISSSGNSPNIVNACLKSQAMGMRTVTLSAMRPDNRIRGLGDLNLHVPAPTYSLSESAHAVILHHWTDRLEQAVPSDA